MVEQLALLELLELTPASSSRPAKRLTRHGRAALAFIGDYLARRRRRRWVGAELLDSRALEELEARGLVRTRYRVRRGGLEDQEVSLTGRGRRYLERLLWARGWRQLTLF